jgi:hypothetical protein
LTFIAAVTRPGVALSPADEGYLGRHDGHGEDVGRERQIGHMGDRFADLVHVHGRLRRDAAVGLADAKGLLAGHFGCAERLLPLPAPGWFDND